MSDDIPAWADARLSVELGVLRARGEGQGLEYMAQFPEQARDLAKEIAAFATSNPGTILLGVSNEGDLIGLDGCDDAIERDKLVRRLEGVCNGTIRPSITPEVRFAVESGKVVLAIVVPKGPQPVYYCNKTPYIRHITESRPGEPHEIIALVATHLAVQPTPTSDEYASVIAQLAFAVAEVLIYSDELKERRVSPWLDQVRSAFVGAAKSARAHAAEDVLVKHGDAPLVNRFADAATRVGTFQLFIGHESWKGLTAAVDEATQLAREIDNKLISTVSQTPAGVQENLKSVRQLGRQVASNATRLPEAHRTGRVEPILYELSMVGANVLHKLVFPLHQIDSAPRASMYAAARFLHLLPTRRTFGPRVESLGDLQAQIEEAAVTLIQSAETAEKSGPSGENAGSQGDM